MFAVLENAGYMCRVRDLELRYPYIWGEKNISEYPKSDERT